MIVWKLESSVICQEDLEDQSHLLQKKTQLEGRFDCSARGKGKGHLLTLAARCLSHQSLLHLGYRELGDINKVVSARHEHSTNLIDQKLMNKEFVIASAEQHEALRPVNASPDAGRSSWQR